MRLMQTYFYCLNLYSLSSCLASLLIISEPPFNFKFQITSLIIFLFCLILIGYPKLNELLCKGLERSTKQGYYLQNINTVFSCMKTKRQDAGWLSGNFLNTFAEGGLFESLSGYQLFGFSFFVIFLRPCRHISG